ncbi:TPA: hypothetical protein IOH86_000208 [Salmonella enterica]|nr:hypothetical protein [Salmonella enterica]HAO4198308.1 hypothetical protein [Salmonella enterica]
MPVYLLQTDRLVFPAPAGINLTRAEDYGDRLGVPRASGDKPGLNLDLFNTFMCSPRQRG